MNQKIDEDDHISEQSSSKEDLDTRCYSFDVSATIKDEFKHADLGDERLNVRLQKSSADLASVPSKSIPEACEDWASTKATYRLSDNPKVNHMKILSSHQEEQKSRLKGLKKILCVSDTTHLTYPENLSIKGLGDDGDSKTDVKGVLLHSTIGIDPKTGRLTGVLDQQVLVKDQQQNPTATYAVNGKEKTRLKSGQEKWMRGANRATKWLPKEIEPIHVFDRGGDDFDHYKKLKDMKSGFVIRASQNRCIRTITGEKSYLLDWSKNLPEIGTTEIHIKQKKGRKARDATLSAQAGTCKLLPPQSSNQADPIQVNVVRFKEIKSEKEPMEWVLLTTEPVEDLDDILKVMRYYQLRWRIEEWHKALKTGCRIEELRLEKWERMEVLLGIYSVIAWRVMELRKIARSDEKIHPQTFITETQIAILEKKYPKLKGKGGKEYAIAVAKIGGYLDRSSDPPPGWIVMWRGLKKLQTMAEGYEILSS